MSYYTGEDNDQDSLWKRIVNPLIFGNNSILKQVGNGISDVYHSYVDEKNQESPLTVKASDLAEDPTVMKALGIGSRQRLPPIAQPQNIPMRPEPAMMQSPLVQKEVSEPQVKKEDFSPDALMGKLEALMKNQQNDTYRSALLHAGAAMMGPGNFGTQLGRGIEAGASALDSGDRGQISNAALLASLGIKADDAKSQSQIIRAQTAKESMENSDIAKRAALAQKAIDTDSNILNAKDRMPPQARAQLQDIVNQYTGIKSSPLPVDNIAKAIGPKVGDVVKGHVFKGGDPNDRNNWEPQ